MDIFCLLLKNAVIFLSFCDGNGGVRGRSPGQIYRRGMPGFFYGNGGMRGAWVGACMGIFGIFWEFLGGLLVRHVIPRGFAVPLSGMARAKMCR